MNSDLDDIADMLTDSIAADGQTPITDPILFSPGTISLPGIAWTVDPNTGFYRISADTVGLTCGGVLVQAWTVGLSSIAGDFAANGSITVGAQLIVSSLGALITGNSTITGTLTMSGALTVSSGGAAITGAITASTSITATTSVTATTALSGATAAGAMLATKAEQITGTATDKLVTPAHQNEHKSAVKAWVKFTGSTGAILAAYNCTVTRNAVGDYTILFTVAMASANFVGHVSCSAIAGAGVNIPVMDRTAAGVDAAPSTAGQRFAVFNAAAAFGAADPDRVYYTAYGDQ